MSSEEKTEEASRQKLRDARKRGEVAVSQELTSAAGFMAVLALLWLAWDAMSLRVRHMLDTALDLTANKARAVDLGPAVERMLVDMLWVVLPLSSAAIAAAMLFAMLQTRGVMSAEPLKISFERMNPGTALTRLFSSRHGVDLLKMLLKLGALLSATAWVLQVFFRPLVSSVYGAADSARMLSTTALFTLFGIAAALFVVLGLVDYGHQFYEFMKQNRMSKTERKREHRDQEGDPNLKSELRSRRFELLAAPPIKHGVVGASVLVTNPTHFAVALYFEPGIVDLPVVVAKGHDEIAWAMRLQARSHAVPIMENPPLARSLFRSVELGEYIGDEHVEAVAEVFRWVATLKVDPSQH